MKGFIMNRILIPIPVPHVIKDIPVFLKKLPQWIHWVANEKKDDGRFNKVPVSAIGRNINAHDPKSWNTFDQITVSFNPAVHSGIAIDLTGKTIAISGTDQEGFLIGVDLDRCVADFATDGTPILTPHAQKVVKALGSYWEISPSGTGIRAFFYADTKVPGKNSGGAEIYSEGRFLTVTGVGQGAIRKLEETEV